MASSTEKLRYEGDLEQASWRRLAPNRKTLGLFGFSGLMAGLHLARGRCEGRSGGFDCALGVLYGALFGFTGHMLMMSLPDPDDSGTKDQQSTGEDP